MSAVEFHYDNAYVRTAADSIDNAVELARILAELVEDLKYVARYGEYTSVWEAVRDTSTQAIELHVILDVAASTKSALDLAIAFEANRARAVHVLRQLGRARETISDKSALAEHLDVSIRCAHDLVDTLLLAPSVIRGARASYLRQRRSIGAWRLATAAARILPMAARPRYEEEFKSELAEIACAGGGRRVQLAYAVRQVMSAARLRHELRAPQHRSAVP
jgi:hypothetical protein